MSDYEWRDIETAPRDGPILLFAPNLRKTVFEAWWAHDYEGGPGYWMTPIAPSGRGYTVLAHVPTHWMPLPAPPEIDT